LAAEPGSISPGLSRMLYRFEDFELDTDAAELRRQGRPVPLQPQVFGVLSYLVEHAGRVAHKEDLLAAVWGTTFVSDSALSTRIKEARRALGDDGQTQRLIKTVHGRGYRFDTPAAGDRPAPAPHMSTGGVRFAVSTDGVSVAYTTTGQGPPFVKAANWLTHLEYDEQSPAWRHLIHALSRDFTLVRYDERGSGLSDRELGNESFSLKAWVRDLEAVVDAAGLGRFPLLGMSQGGAVAISYAVAHPERISHLILHGTYARGRNLRGQEQTEVGRALLALAAEGWGDPKSAFARLFASLMMPSASEDDTRWLIELQRVSASRRNVSLFRAAFAVIDVERLLSRVRVPTLVVHCRGDQMVPFEEGRRLAVSIPGAQFLPLDSDSHLVLENEPAWQIMIGAIRDFVR
jgi:DNA-binding winged helix-turn-helix (wHTH) protein/pimeloyl-ACP methyl ester carboxylesterase